MELLTTHQVQQMLKVDRSTIYRLIERGHLQALRVGKQWRFSADAIARLIASSPRSPEAAQWLPIPYAQHVQDAFADLLGVMMVTTDMHGQPLTAISNPCGFFRALVQRPEAMSRCIETWQRLASLPSLEPSWQLSEMGLLCARGLIRDGAQLKGMVVVGGVAPRHWPPSDEQLEALARAFDVAFSQLKLNAGEVCWLNAEGQARALRAAQRLADVFSLWITEGRAFQN